MVSIYVKVPAALLLASFILLGMIMPVSAQSIAFLITGYANVNGVPTNGVQVSCNGASYTTASDQSGHAGSYALMPPNISNGSHVTVNFNYNGHTTSVSVTANGNRAQAPTANIVYQTSTPTPSAAATPTPTAITQSGSSGSAGSTSLQNAYATVTPIPTVAATIQPTAQATQAPTIAPTITPTPVAATATPTPTQAAASPNLLQWLPVLAGLGAIGVVAAVYLLLRRH